jgi:predicted hydrocarbon binding protein
MLAAVASQVLGGPAVALEHACAAMGAARCVFVARPRQA